jgi:hypothetical protein
MSKWYGKIGYAETVETEPGIWVEQITERPYFGDSYRNTRLLQNSDGVNDNINIGNQISIVADPYATQNFHAMRYVEFMGNNWKITNVEVQYPRLILTIGGLNTNGQ